MSGNMRATYSYRADGLLSSVLVNRFGFPEPQHLDSFTAYDDVGRPTAMSRTTFGNASYSNGWQYDARGNATVSNWDGVVNEYGYDRSGNRAWERNQGGTTVFDYYYGGTSGSTESTLSNRLYLREKAQGPPGIHGADFTYDENGNLELRDYIDSSLSVPYLYDAAQRLYTHNSTDLNDVQYRYDGLGRLYRSRSAIENLDANDYRYFSHDGTNVGSVYIPASGEWEFVQRPGVDQPLVVVPANIGQPCYLVTSGGRLITTHDGGAGVCTTGAAAAVPYSGAIGDSWSFDQDRTPSWSLSFFRNRWYDSQTGRFTQEDPIGYAGGQNLYSYGGNAPAAYTDPFGLCVPRPWCEKWAVAQEYVGRRVSATRHAVAEFAQQTVGRLGGGAEATIGHVQFALGTESITSTELTTPVSIVASAEVGIALSGYGSIRLRQAPEGSRPVHFQIGSRRIGVELTTAVGQGGIVPTAFSISYGFGITTGIPGGIGIEVVDPVATVD